jgi:hypothetical protein
MYASKHNVHSSYKGGRKEREKENKKIRKKKEEKRNNIRQRSIYPGRLKKTHL